jgi:hypothetical protein
MANPSKCLTLKSSAAHATTFTSAAIDLPAADAYSIIVSVTAASGTSPTLDVVFQNTPDGGTTWVNMPLRSAQLTTVSANHLQIAPGGFSIADSTATAATGGILSENYVPSPKIRIVGTIGGTNPSFTFAIYAFMKSIGGR